MIVQLRNGPQLYFGPTAQLARKWTAAVAVLQNKGSAGAAYIDVTDPQRPAAGAAYRRCRRPRWGSPTAPTTGTSTTTDTGG